MSNILRDPTLEALLADLHARSDAQTAATEEYFSGSRTGPWRGTEPPFKGGFEMSAKE